MFPESFKEVEVSRLEMENSRLTNLKEKASYFSFDIVHVPGRYHKGPDAVSRVPKEEQDEAELAAIMAGVSTKELQLDILKATRTKEILSCSTSEDKGIQSSLEYKYLDTEVQAQVAMVENKNDMAVTWERIAEATERDQELVFIREVVQSGSHRDILEAKEKFQEYRSIMEKLSALDGVVLYKGRAVIPRSLRGKVLSILHSARQGVSSITKKQNLVFIGLVVRGYKEDQV